MKIVFATHNLHKAEEAQKILGADYQVVNLHDLQCPEIPETAQTLEGNAVQKAQFVLERYHCDCFADDTGLEIEALGNRPGVYSARYAGENGSFEDNVNKVLHEMQGITNRKACFKTVICLLLNGEKHLFEGRVDGTITKSRHGENGFGYDPIFLPDGFEQTFAEMDADTKNHISHRGRAMQKLIAFLKNHTTATETV
ncbi:MAG: non-canonical purine NTP diphosphatase, partial [Paludibacteraceae bacterium]|nr:non-canonical purine NTP diphosphatase [Paludibacteraceae bacterium]